MSAKRIDIHAFANDRPDEAERQRALFERMGATSYEQRLKFFFNEWRLRYPLLMQPAATTQG
jgi:hypothetical protein